MTKRAKGAKLLNRTLMHTAAKLYYIEGVPQLQVAERMQVSTATVSRLLAGAREEGIVKFEVPDLAEVDELGDALSAALGLTSVRVLESEKPAALATQVDGLLNASGLGAGKVLAIGWGRTVQSVIQAGLPRLPGVIVVPTMGGMHQTASHFQINEFVRNVAEQTQGEACFLFAPSLASKELRDELLRDPATARVLELWGRTDAVIVGVGDFQHAQSMRDMEFAPEMANRIAGDVARHYFDVDGQIVDWPGYANLMAITPEQLRRAPLSIGVAVGRSKAQSIIGAARSGMINALVTDLRAGLAVLEIVGE